MTGVIHLGKLIGPPGSMGFLALCCAAGLFVGCVGPRSRRVARLWLLAVFISHVIAALPAVSHALAGRLPSYGPMWTPESAADADVLVVLSGDNPWGRAKEAHRVIDVITPRCIVVSGGTWFAGMVVAAGVARDGLVLDDTTTTTREQIAKVGAWAERCGAQRVVLIASILSMPRIAALARTTGVPVVLVPSPLDDAPANSGIRVAVPSFRALRLTRDAVYEHMALAYYRYHGWIW